MRAADGPRRMDDDENRTTKTNDGCPMALKIEQDKARYRQIIRGKVRKNLRKFITKGELLGRQGKDIVSIPLPEIQVPRFRFDEKQRQGVGQGPGGPGDPVDGEEEGEATGRAGDKPGEHVIEEELTIAELAEILGEELELPRIEPRGRHELRTTHLKYTGIRKTGPESLRHFRRTYRAALKRQIAAGTYDPNRPVIIPIRPHRQRPGELTRSTEDKHSHRTHRQKLSRRGSPRVKGQATSCRRLKPSRSPP